MKRPRIGRQSLGVLNLHDEEYCMKKYMMRKASMDVINWLNCIWLTDLPPNSKYLACYLRKFMNSNHDMAWPSYARMIQETGLSRQTIMRHMNNLEKSGWIKREKGNSNTNTVYFATLPEILNEEVRRIDSAIQEKIKGSSTMEPRSSTKELEVVPSGNSNTQCNKQSNKQELQTTFETKADEFFISELSNDFPNCIEMIRCMEIEGKYFTGKLSLEEWQYCESQMNIDIQMDHQMYVTWFTLNRLKSFRKKPSLPNLVSDMNGINFDKIYESAESEMECRWE